jgi:hypothetical protein
MKLCHLCPVSSYFFYAECRYAECRYAEIRGAVLNALAFCDKTKNTSERSLVVQAAGACIIKHFTGVTNSVA